LKHAKTPLTAGDRGEPMGLIMGEPRRGIEIRSRNTCETGESDTRSRSHGFSVSHGEILPHSNLYALDTMNAEGRRPESHGPCRKRSVECIATVCSGTYVVKTRCTSMNRNFFAPPTLCLHGTCGCERHDAITFTVNRGGAAHQNLDAVLRRQSNPTWRVRGPCHTGRSRSSSTLRNNLRVRQCSR
jgi:hypothetical protein